MFYNSFKTKVLIMQTFKIWSIQNINTLNSAVFKECLSQWIIIYEQLPWYFYLFILYENIFYSSKNKSRTS